MTTRNWHSLPEYQALRAVMESGTTSAAASRLGLSQSAISRSISSLEARTGQILFEREAGRLVATREAVQLNHRLDPLFEALNRLSGPPERGRETLRLIAPPTYAHRFLTAHIASFIATNPHAYIQMVSTDGGGRDVKWSMEMGSPMYLYARGWRPRTLRPGTEVTVRAHPLRSGKAGGVVLDVVDADGKAIGSNQ